MRQARQTFLRFSDQFVSRLRILERKLNMIRRAVQIAFSRSGNVNMV